MYDVIMADPPWPQNKGGLRSVRKNQGRQLDYHTMSVPECFDCLQSEGIDLAAPSHTIFLWSIEKYLVETELEMKSRGYRLHCRLVWNKQNGVAPAFSIRYTHEYLLWYYRPKFQPVAIEARGKYPSVIDEPSRGHSRKPEAAYSLVEALYPNARRLDMFARQRREGWDYFGNEILY